MREREREKERERERDNMLIYLFLLTVGKNNFTWNWYIGSNTLKHWKTGEGNWYQLQWDAYYWVTFKKQWKRN